MAVVQLCSPKADSFFEDLVENADRMFYFKQGPRSPLRMVSRAHPRMHGGQRIMPVFAYGGVRKWQIVWLLL
ncbi:Uncharacterised protein [uncultured archaeon]|nr:Uncharacterised protein [uncultured archaeon]